MNEAKWEVVRQFYMDSFGIAPELVDLMASNEILLMCVSGSSNESISKILNIDVDAVTEILDVVLSFPGWNKDLEFSPYNIYKQDNSFIGFVGTIVETIGNEQTDTTIDAITLMYSSCRIYEEVEEMLDVGWK